MNQSINKNQSIWISPNRKKRKLPHGLDGEHNFKIMSVPRPWKYKAADVQIMNNDKQTYAYGKLKKLNKNRVRQRGSIGAALFD